MAIRSACPFCGGLRTDIKSQQHYGRYHWVQCIKCDARGPRRDTRKAAVEGWEESVTPRLTAAALSAAPVPLEIQGLLTGEEE